MTPGIYRLVNILAVDGNHPFSHLNMNLAVLIKGALAEAKGQTVHDHIADVCGQLDEAIHEAKPKRGRRHPAQTTMISRYSGNCRECGTYILRYETKIGKNSKGLWVCADCASKSHLEAVS